MAKTIKDATREWGRGFNRIDLDMIAQLMQVDLNDWEEVTLPSKYDRVYVESCCFFNKDDCYNGSEKYGEITDVLYDSRICVIELDDDTKVQAIFDDIEVQRDDALPMWGTMWSFDNPLDDEWLKNWGGLEKMSECGFRVFHSDKYGYFFGIDGAGYDFYESHWIPLYKARGLKWHDTEEES